MPIYEFRCARCGHEFERLQKFTDPDPARCPKCKAAAISRMISPVGFRLKGGGWYETDFKRSGRHNVLEPEKSADGPNKKSEEADAGKAADKKAGDKKKPAETGGGKRQAGKAADGQAAA